MELMREASHMPTWEINHFCAYGNSRSSAMMMTSHTVLHSQFQVGAHRATTLAFLEISISIIYNYTYICR